jgi:hypothetical protein
MKPGRRMPRRSLALPVAVPVLFTILIVGMLPDHAGATVAPCASMYEPDLFRRYNCGARANSYFVPGVQGYLGAGASTCLRGDRAVLLVKRPSLDTWQRFRTATFNARGQAKTSWDVPLRCYRTAWRFRWVLPSRDQRSVRFKIRVVGD